MNKTEWMENTLYEKITKPIMNPHTYTYYCMPHTRANPNSTYSQIEYTCGCKHSKVWSNKRHMMHIEFNVELSLTREMGYSAVDSCQRQMRIECVV